MSVIGFALFSICIGPVLILSFFLFHCIHQQLKKITNSTDYLLPDQKTVRHSLPVDDDLIDNVFITVKTTGRNHLTRLPVIIKTWFQLAKKQVLLYFYYSLYSM
jgi:hypothetical protein